MAQIPIWRNNSSSSTTKMHSVAICLGCFYVPKHQFRIEHRVSHYLKHSYTLNWVFKWPCEFLVYLGDIHIKFYCVTHQQVILLDTSMEKHCSHYWTFAMMSSYSKCACPRYTHQSAYTGASKPKSSFATDTWARWHLGLTHSPVTPRYDRGCSLFLYGSISPFWQMLLKTKPLCFYPHQNPWTHMPPQEVVFIYFVPTLQREFVQYFLSTMDNTIQAMRCINGLCLHFIGITNYQPNRYMKLVLSTLTFCQLQQLNMIAIKIYTAPVTTASWFTVAGTRWPQPKHWPHRTTPLIRFPLLRLNVSWNFSFASFWPSLSHCATDTYLSSEG